MGGRRWVWAWVESLPRPPRPHAPSCFTLNCASVAVLTDSMVPFHESNLTRSCFISPSSTLWGWGCVGGPFAVGLGRQPKRVLCVHAGRAHTGHAPPAAPAPSKLTRAPHKTGHSRRLRSFVWVGVRARSARATCSSLNQQSTSRRAAVCVCVRALCTATPLIVDCAVACVFRGFVCSPSRLF